MKISIKKLSILLLALILVISSGLLIKTIDKDKLVADTKIQDGEKNIVSVKGKGVISAEPNIAYVNLAVETENKNIKKAQEENSKIMAKLIKEIKSLGIDEKHIQTKDYSIREQYDWKNEQNIFRGYEIRNAITIKITDIKKAGTVLDKGVDAGANVAGGISFDIENRDDLYNEALKLAMKSAESKANAIMGTFGAKPSKPYRVEEIAISNVQYTEMYNAKVGGSADSEDSETNIQGGSLSVVATVEVDYAY